MTRCLLLSRRFTVLHFALLLASLVDLFTGCAVRQPCVNGHWLCQWQRAIFDPPLQNRHPSTDHQKLSQVITSKPLQQIKCTSVHGGFWAHGWNITQIIFIYALFFEELTYWLKRRGLAQGCAFLVFIWLSIWGSKTLKAILGREQACSRQTREIEKRAYYKNYCIDSNHILHSDKCPSWVVPPVTTPNHPFFKFGTPFHIFVVGRDRDFKFGRQVDTSKSQPAYHPWNGWPPSWKNRKKYLLLTDIINSQLKTGNKTAISANIGLNVQKNCSYTHC